MSEQKKKNITVNGVEYPYMYTNRHGIAMYKVNKGYLSEEKIKQHQKILQVDRTEQTMEIAKKSVAKENSKKVKLEDLAKLNEINEEKPEKKEKTKKDDQ